MYIKTLSFIFILSLALFLVNDFALKANLYWTTPWADIITHMMGGMVVAGIVILIHSFNGYTKALRMRSVLVLSVFVGILWEIFELYNGMTFISDKGYWLDTAGDIFFDMLGAYLSYRFLIKSSNKK